MTRRILSGVQPTGSLHLGNYLGAIKQFVSLQNEGDTECFYCIVDLHAITQKQDPKLLRANTRKIAAAYLACGVDPRKSHIFVQSSVPHHTELNWYLQCVARVGWMDRMTQFREKTGTVPPANLRETIRRIETDLENDPHNLNPDDVKVLLELARMRESNREKASVGLYTYPVLQAADILLYKATHVPVGSDQLQHINLAADVAGKFNNDYATIFPKPKAIVSSNSARIMSLRDGNKKMSKSDPDDNSRINLDDTGPTLGAKMNRATSMTEWMPDTVEELTNPSVINLLGIYSALSDLPPQEALNLFAGKGCGYFKGRLNELLDAKLRPIRTEMERYLTDPFELDAILCTGGQKVEVVADKTMKEVRDAMGFWNPFDVGGMPYV